MVLLGVWPRGYTPADLGVMQPCRNLTKVPFVDSLRAKVVEDISLDDIKTDDKTFQYRFTTRVGDLKNSLQVEGQREPIDLTGSKPYSIIDGFRRVEAFRALGWNKVKALVHKGISEEEAHKLAFIKNVVRKNLSPMDKANAIFQAKQRGMETSELIDYFSLSEKQLKRYEALLEFPAEIQKLLEKESIPMGHAKVLADFKVKDKALDEWVERINQGLSAKKVKRELKKTSGVRTGGKPKLYMKKGKDGFRMYPFTITKDAPPSERERVLRLLKEAIELLGG
jgi:ParB/RepB/Spo0J family partition protein